MQGDSKTIDKAPADPVQAALSRMFKINAGGALGIVGALFAGFVWVQSQLDTMIRSAVRAEISTQMEPLNKRVERLEFESEVQKRLTERQKPGQ